MNKSSLWIVVVVAASWIGFLMGYAMSAHTGGAKIEPGAVAEKAPVSAGAGGYGQ
jgi:hypothetical protein